MSLIPWREIFTTTLIAFCGLSLHGLVFAMLATQGKEITRASAARYFGYILFISFAFSVMAAALH